MRFRHDDSNSQTRNALRVAARCAVLAVALITLGASDARAQASCGEWQPGLTATQLPGKSVNVLTTWDDGTGPALYAGGAFMYAGNTLANHVARWDGQEWHALGGGVDGTVWAMTTFDDGDGEALYVGGRFDFAGGKPANNIAKWNGTEWSEVGGGTNQIVAALVAWDDGTGPALYVGGRFTRAGGAESAGLARFDGNSFSPVGLGIGGGLSMVVAFQPHDDGTGPAMYVGGNFQTAGGAPATNLARWDGRSWTPVGIGFDGLVFCLAEWDDGNEVALYVGGSFQQPTTQSMPIARWDGTAFTFLGGGLSGAVHDLYVFDDGTGSRLYAAGELGRLDPPISKVAAWDGSSWSSLAGGTNHGCRSLAAFDDGSGPRLYVGGYFTTAGGHEAYNLSSWDGSDWRPLRVGGFNAPVRALQGLEHGTERWIFAGGEFTAVNDRPASRVARWDEREWHPLGPGLDGVVNALCAFDDGTGSALYAAGEFTASGGTPLNHVARWDGTRWTALGSGLPGNVLALAVHDDGTGAALYAGGDFDDGAGIRGAARWDGSRWSAVGGGIDDQVRTFEVFEFGGRSVLIAAGRFARAGAVAASNVAAWDGNSWAPLSAGTNGPINALATFENDDFGRRLYAGGEFTVAGGNGAMRLAAWDGESWSGFQVMSATTVTCLAAYDDGGGPALYIGGAGLWGNAVRIVRWDGRIVSALGRGLSGDPLAMVTHRDSQGLSLYVGGRFPHAGDLVSRGIGRYANPCASAFAGTVDLGSGQAKDVLFANDSAGGRERRVELTTYEPLTIWLAEPPASKSAARFALYLWTGELDPNGRRTLPFGLGTTCLPTPLSGGSSRIRAIWNNTGRAALGTPTLPSSPAPSAVLTLPAGVGMPATFVLQGIIADPNSIGERRASVTNGLVVSVR